MQPPAALVVIPANTTEPHLHIHAVDAQSGDISAGNGVPIAFDGRFPVRNRTFRR
jgi:hypothetical protein